MPGYTLVDRSKCIAQNNSSLLLFFAHDHFVWRMTGQGHDVEPVANTTGASGLDFHYSRNQLYWSDVKTRKVYK
jgi:low density lipoprotein-related protein 2